MGNQSRGSDLARWSQCIRPKEYSYGRTISSEASGPELRRTPPGHIQAFHDKNEWLPVDGFLPHMPIESKKYSFAMFSKFRLVEDNTQQSVQSNIIIVLDTWRLKARWQKYKLLVTVCPQQTSDSRALKSQLSLKGSDWEAWIVYVPSRLEILERNRE